LQKLLGPLGCDEQTLQINISGATLKGAPPARQSGFTKEKHFWVNIGVCAIHDAKRSQLL